MIKTHSSKTHKTLHGFWQLVRPWQWIKNLFILVPLFCTPDAYHHAHAPALALVVLSFILLSSAVYIFNDLCDVRADRLHPLKKNRPLAAETISQKNAIIAMLILLGCGFFIMQFLGNDLLIMGLLYILLNVFYCLWFKHLAIWDIFCVTAGFLLRVEAGSLPIDVSVSIFLFNIIGLLALFIVLAKRRDDVVKSPHKDNLYSKEFLDNCLPAILAALLTSYMIYVTDVRILDNSVGIKLFWTIPFVTAGILRYLQCVMMKEWGSDPTRLLFKDKLLLSITMAWGLSFILIIHGIL